MSYCPELTDMHVVTENGEQCFMWRSSRLSYIAQDRTELPDVLATKFGPFATKLDLSYNSLTSYDNINLFTNLNELILDNNSLDDRQINFTQNLRLKTLSLNKNKLTNLSKLINSIKVCFPNLEYLSLIGNPLCPIPILIGSSETDNKFSASSISFASLDQYSSNNLAKDTSQLPTKSIRAYQTTIDERQTELACQKYRLFVIHHLPNLRFLDSIAVTWRERDEALRRCYWVENSNTITDATSPPRSLFVPGSESRLRPN